jgi:hypothetical protein
VTTPGSRDHHRGVLARVSESRHRRLLESVGALLVYVAFTLYLTWPLVAHLGSTVYLYPKVPPGPGDLAGGIAQLRALVDGHHNPFLPGRLHEFNAPDGMQIRWALNLASFPSTLLLYGLAFVFGATAAYGLFAMLGYIASGVAMFLLVRKLTANAWIGLVIGWAFAFYPFAVVKGEHPNFVHGWVFVVMAWRLLELMERPTVRNGVYAGAAAVLALSWMQYFILLGGVCFAALAAAVLIVGMLRGELRRHVVALLPAVGIVVFFGLTMRALLQGSGDAATLPGNTLADIVATSAHLPMYVVPPVHNILLGDATRHYLTAHGWNAVEWTLYVGVMMMLLALVAVAAALTRRLAPQAARTVGAFVLVLVTAVVFSLPPQTEIGGHVVRLPSYLSFEAATGWRLYTRFVIVVMLAISALAGLGLQALVRRSGRRTGAALLAAATILIPLDLWDRPPDTTYRIKTPGIYSVVRAEPPGIVAEYPLRPVLDARDYLDLYYQHAHGKPILNGYFSGGDEQRALSLTRLDGATAGSLATLGVRYVLLTPQRLGPDLPDPGRPSRGFHFIVRDDYASLYRVVAKPTPFIYARSGLEPFEGPPGKRFRWASDSRVVLEIDAPCNHCVGTLRFTSASLGTTRLLRVAIGHAQPRPVHVVRVVPTPISIPLRFHRRVRLQLITTPGVRSIHDVTGAPDPRRVSISIQGLTFVPRRR